MTHVVLDIKDAVLYQPKWTFNIAGRTYQDFSGLGAILGRVTFKCTAFTSHKAECSWYWFLLFKPRIRSRRRSSIEAL